MACEECSRLRREMDLANAEEFELMRTPPPAGVTTLKEAIDNLREVFRNSSVDKRMFAAAMAFQQHANVCEDPDSRRQIHLEFLGCYYNLSRDADTKQEIMEKMKALL